MRRVLALLACAVSAPAQDADYGTDALRARVEVLRPDIEAELGAPLGEAVDVVVATPESLRDLLANEFAEHRAEIADGPRGEELEKQCKQEAELVSKSALAKVDLRRGAIHVCPDNFRRIAALDPSWKGLVSQDALDAVLLHEMVHVFQVRRLGLARYVGLPTAIEQLMAKGAVVEGHAQYVGRRAAKRRGLDAAFALIDRTQTTIPASVEDPGTRHLSEILGTRFSFAYVEGEKFVEAIAEALGYPAAVQRIFSQPPATLRAVSRPEEYLNPPEEDRSLDELVAKVRRFLTEEGRTPTVMPLAIPMLRAGLALAGREVADVALRGFDKGATIQGARDGEQITIAVLVCRDEEAGARLYDADVATCKAKDELFGRPGAQIRIVSATYRSIATEDGAGIECVKTAEALAVGSRRAVETVIVRHGKVTLEVTVSSEVAPRGLAARIVREVLELLRGAETADPWDGKRGEEAKRALLEALEDVRWGVRWRAARNLARMNEDTAIDRALARMLRDPDSSVRCAALGGLVRRGWLDRASAEQRDEVAASPDWRLRLAYHRAMAAREVDGPARGARLVLALEDSHAAVRAYAFDKLADLSMEDRIPWAQSRAGIGDPDPDVRRAAIDALPRRGLPFEALPVLLKARRDEDPWIRDCAVCRLDRWVKTSPEALEALIAALADESGLVRMDAARGLREAGRDGAPAIHALCGLLDDEVERRVAAEALGEIGIPDPEAMRKLEAVLCVGNISSRFAVARALRRLGSDPTDLAPVFAEMLREGKDWQRDDGAEELGSLGELARPHIGDLVAALKDKEAAVRKDAAKALGNLGAVAEEALPALEALGAEETEGEAKVDENREPVFEFGGEASGSDVRRAARDAAQQIRAALADRER